MKPSKEFIDLFIKELSLKLKKWGFSNEVSGKNTILVYKNGNPENTFEINFSSFWLNEESKIVTNLDIAGYGDLIQVEENNSQSTEDLFFKICEFLKRT
jgi:hypothetical protein